MTRNTLCNVAAAVATLLVVAHGHAAAGSTRAWRQTYEGAIVAELMHFLSIRNVATNVDDMRRNAAYAEEMLARRGLRTQQLAVAPDAPPAVFAELLTPGAQRTVIVYAHMDGQPAPQRGWLEDPWHPVLRDGRMYARSASDDKGPIVALVAALDAVRASGRKPSINIKVLLEGEEEQGSPHLAALLDANRELLDADAWLLCDGAVHSSRRMQVFFGARGMLGVEMTVYGALRPLHSGHYGNWAANPAVALAHLLAALRDEHGRILIPGFYDDVQALTAAERAALAALPEVETALERELGIARPESDLRLADSLMAPALNVRGIAAGNVGSDAENAIPTQARLSIDFRLVPGQTEQRVRERVEAFLRTQGWWIVREEPGLDVRRAHPRIIRVTWAAGYSGERTDMMLPVSSAIVATLNRTQQSTARRGPDARRQRADESVRRPHPQAGARRADRESRQQPARHQREPSSAESLGWDRAVCRTVHESGLVSGPLSLRRIIRNSFARRCRWCADDS
jgi:acetylornithine deacetylase/succinyl-diaminopimelate desuccinylase-like protein